MPVGAVIGEGGGGLTQTYEKFADQAAIEAAYPDGSVAKTVVINEATDTVWTWDVDSGAWSDTGTKANIPIANVTGLQGVLNNKQAASARLSEIAALAPNADQIIKWDGENWVVADVSGGGWTLLEYELPGNVTLNKSDLSGANYLLITNPNYSSMRRLTLGTGFSAGDELMLVCSDESLGWVALSIGGFATQGDVGKAYHCLYDGNHWIINQMILGAYSGDTFKENVYIGRTGGSRSQWRNVVIGDDAVNGGANDSVIIGHNTYGMGDAVVLGESARANNHYGMAVGHSAYSDGDKTAALGYEADTNSQDRAIALGAYSYPRFPNEIGQRIYRGGSDSINDSINPSYHRREVSWTGQTSNSTPLNLSMPFTSTGPAIQAKNAITYDGIIQAFKSDYTGVASWKFVGTLVRDASNTVRLIGKSVTAIGSDGTGTTLAVDVILDQANNKLLIEATGNESETWHWSATATLLDTRIA